MIYITGDTHCPFDISKLKPHHFPEGQILTKEDYVIICGDFGAVWDDMLPDLFWRDWLDSQPWTTLFVDGNHENFELLDDYPVSRTRQWGNGTHPSGLSAARHGDRPVRRTERQSSELPP